MSPELSIRIDYLNNRQNPAEIFQAMAMYVDAHKDLGQLLTNSIGLHYDFEFQLNGIEEGSILSRLSALPSQIGDVIEAAVYNSSYKLFVDLSDTDETASEDDVEKLAINLESSLAKELPQQISDPHIDRQGLAFALNSFSVANQKIRSGETVEFSIDSERIDKCGVNTGWRFTGTPKEMFLGNTTPHRTTICLSVTSLVNEGNAVWGFKCDKLPKGFSARILEKKWLERYQNALVPAIGAKDTIEAEISYDIYTPPNGKGKPQIRNAKILKIITIHRNNECQDELPIN